jgi:hypothetical protein
MAKKQVAVSLRKPPPPADLAALVVESVHLDAGPTSDVRELRAEAPKADAFVGAAKNEKTWEPVPGKRSITVQLPESVVDRLLAYCRLHERELNDVVAEIIARHLAEQRPATSSFESAMRWVRSQLTILSSTANGLRARALQFAGM